MEESVVIPLAEAEARMSTGPLPLYPRRASPKAYPLDALGPVLSRGAGGIARKVCVPDALAGQSVLAAASLAAQAHADVQLPFGQCRPLSLYCVTVAGSGDRKSSADNEALWPLRKRERALREKFDADLEDWQASSAAWHAKRKRIESDKGIEDLKGALLDLGPEPARPLHPMLTFSDATWSNAEQMGREFLTYTLEPWLRALEGCLRRALFTPEEFPSHRIAFDRDDLTRADIGARATACPAAR